MRTPKPRRAITADELMSQLEADPEWRARRDKRDAVEAELAAECAADEKLLVAEIRKLGYDIESVWDFVNNTPHPDLERRFVGPYERAYPVLVAHLNSAHHPRIREGIVRALTVRDGGPPVIDALLKAFEAETAPLERWVLANALQTAMPYSRRRKVPGIAAALRMRGA